MPDNKWGWHQYVSYYKVRNKWPQLLNHRMAQGLYCPKDFESRQQFSKLVDIALGEGDKTIKTSDLIPLIVRFRVANWPKPVEFTWHKIRYSDLDADQKQKVAYLAYWLGINLKPRNPKYHAPVSNAYQGLNGTSASVRMTGTGRSWRQGERARQWKT